MSSLHLDPEASDSFAAHREPHGPSFIASSSCASSSSASSPSSSHGPVILDSSGKSSSASILSIDSSEASAPLSALSELSTRSASPPDPTDKTNCPVPPAAYTEKAAVSGAASDTDSAQPQELPAVPIAHASVNAFVARPPRALPFSGEPEYGPYTVVPRHSTGIPPWYADKQADIYYVQVANFPSSYQWKDLKDLILSLAPSIHILQVRIVTPGSATLKIRGLQNSIHAVETLNDYYHPSSGAVFTASFLPGGANCSSSNDMFAAPGSPAIGSVASGAVPIASAYGSLPGGTNFAAAAGRPPDVVVSSSGYSGSSGSNAQHYSPRFGSPLNNGAPARASYSPLPPPPLPPPPPPPPQPSLHSSGPSHAGFVRFQHTQLNPHHQYLHQHLHPNQPGKMARPSSSASSPHHAHSPHYEHNWPPLGHPPLSHEPPEPPEHRHPLSSPSPSLVPGADADSGDASDTSTGSASAASSSTNSGTPQQPPPPPSAVPAVSSTTNPPHSKRPSSQSVGPAITAEHHHHYHHHRHPQIYSLPLYPAGVPQFYPHVHGMPPNTQHGLLPQPPPAPPYPIFHPMGMYPLGYADMAQAQAQVPSKRDDDENDIGYPHLSHSQYHPYRAHYDQTGGTPRLLPRSGNASAGGTPTLAHAATANYVGGSGKHRRRFQSGSAVMYPPLGSESEGAGGCSPLPGHTNLSGVQFSPGVMETHSYYRPGSNSSSTSSGSGGGSSTTSGGGVHGRAPMRPQYRLFIGNIPFSTKWQELKDHLRAAGHIFRVEIPESPDGRPKGFAIATYLSEDTAENAIRMFHETLFRGRELTVRYDMYGPQPPRTGAQVGSTLPPQQQQQQGAPEQGGAYYRHRIGHPRQGPVPMQSYGTPGAGAASYPYSTAAAAAAGYGPPPPHPGLPPQYVHYGQFAAAGDVDRAALGPPPQLMYFVGDGAEEQDRDADREEDSEDDEGTVAEGPDDKENEAAGAQQTVPQPAAPSAKGSAPDMLDALDTMDTLTSSLDEVA